jgi:hypothetical protein
MDFYVLTREVIQVPLRGVFTRYAANGSKRRTIFRMGFIPRYDSGNMRNHYSGYLAGSGARDELVPLRNADLDPDQVLHVGDDLAALADDGPDARLRHVHRLLRVAVAHVG